VIFALEQRRFLRVGVATLPVSFVALVLLVACGAGCSRARASRPPDVGVQPLPGRSVVIGRVEIYKEGQRVNVGPRTAPLFGWITGARPLTDLHLVARHSHGEKMNIEIQDADGWFVAQLPAGKYGMGIRYYIYLFDTPATVAIPEGGRRYYVGTLRVNLFVRGSFQGGIAETAGGVIPQDDIDFTVVRDDLGSHLGAEERLITLAQEDG
jgi:hypothetical protein